MKIQSTYAQRLKLANKTTTGDVWLPINGDDYHIIRVLKDSAGHRFVFVDANSPMFFDGEKMPWMLILKDTLAREYCRLLP